MNNQLSPSELIEVINENAYLSDAGLPNTNSQPLYRKAFPELPKVGTQFIIMNELWMTLESLSMNINL